MAGQINPLMSLVGQPGVYSSVDPLFIPPTEIDKVSVKQLDQKNAEYEARREAWTNLSLLYEGGDYLKVRAERVLKKRPREDEEVFAARLDSFTYQNILATGLGWYGAAMFDNPPEMFFNGKAKNPFYDQFIENCDGVGTTYIDFWKKCFQFLLIYGAAWVLTDLRAIGLGEAPPVSLEEERQRGLLDPHLVAYTPLNVINWREDDRGELEWAVIKTEVDEQEFLGKREIVSTWYYYDREIYRVYEHRRGPEERLRMGSDDLNQMATLLRSGPHALAHKKRLPVRRVILSESLWLANRAYLLLIDHLNQDNTLKWSLFMSNLAIPIIIGDTDAGAMTASESGFLQFPSGTEYMWSEPEGKSFIHSSKRVESLREECFRSMNLQAQGRSMRATPAMQSGRSKQLEMAPSKQILSGMGADLRRHMQNVLVDVRDARKEDDGIEPDVRGPNFQDDMTTEEVFAVSSLLGLRIPSEKFEKYVQKKVAKSWMTDANRNEIVEVYAQIDAGPTLEEREDDDFKKRVKLAKEGMKTSLAGPPPGPPQPAGRGGSGGPASSRPGPGPTPDSSK